MAIDINALVGDVQKALRRKLPDALTEFAAARMAAFEDKRDNETEPVPDWQQKGYVLFRVIARVFGNRMMLKATAFGQAYSRGHKNGGFTFIEELPAQYEVSELGGAQREEVFSRLLELVGPMIQENKEDVFAPAVEVALAFEPFDKNGISDNGLSEYAAIIERGDTAAWRRMLHELAAEMERGDTTPFADLWNVYWAVWQYEFDRDAERMLGFIDSFYKKIWANSKLRARECRENTCWILSTICNWIGVRGGALSGDEQALFRYTGNMKIEREESQDSVRRGRELIKLADAGAKLSPPPPAEDVFRELNDKNVALKAVYHEDGREDYFEEGLESRGSVNCKIRNEGEDAYAAALRFMTDIVKDGFSPRCDFSFSSDQKNYIELRNSRSGDNELVLQNAQNQFWANCMQYPALRGAMRDYVKLCAKKVTPLREDEMEEDEAFRRRPDFFAAAALTLADPTGRDFEECFGAYLSTTGFDGLEGIFYLAYTYFDKYGVTEQNADNLAKAIGRDPFGMSCELFGDYLTDRPGGTNTAALTLLLNAGKRQGLELEELEEMLEDA